MCCFNKVNISAILILLLYKCIVNKDSTVRIMKFILAVTSWAKMHGAVSSFRSQWFVHYSWNDSRFRARRFVTVFTVALHSFLTLSHVSRVRDLPPYFIKAHFNIIFSTPGFSQWCLYFRFPQHCRANSHKPSFGYSNNTWYADQITVGKNLTFWRRNYFFNFSSPVYKTANNTGTKQVRIMKQTEFWRGGGQRRVCTMFKIFGTYVCWINM